MWTESGPNISGGSGSLSVYYGGGVFNGHFYTGQLSYGPLAYSSRQLVGTALVHDYDCLLHEPELDPTRRGTRCSTLIGNYIFWNNNDGILHRLESTWSNNVRVDGHGGFGGGFEGITTNGTDIFVGHRDSGVRNIIKRYSINNQANSFSITEVATITLPASTRFRALSYYEPADAVYVVDSESGKGIYEIDVASGTYTLLGTHVGSGGYQAVRYNDKILVVGTDDMLTVYDFTGGTLGSSTIYPLYQGDLYGLGVVGNGTEVIGFWVTSGGKISYFA
ncbi:MAG: hypothetical protein RBT40_10240, partial [Petrimonas sp.]|nr:hypothetical protein [Petrimonas sp.]